MRHIAGRPTESPEDEDVGWKHVSRATRSLVAALAIALAATPVAGQQSDQHNFVLAGYGTAGYNRMLGGGSANDFSSSISAILLYSTGDFLFESELEYELEEVATETELEYAQLDYEGLDNVQFVVGKFLLPFGVFGERLHPTWINKLPLMTSIFGMDHEGVPYNSLFPVLSDLGAMARWSAPVGGGGWNMTASAYVTQGPALPSPDVAAESAGEPGYIDVPAPQIAWGRSFTDNGPNKMVGGRIGVNKAPFFEGYVSGLRSQYDPANPDFHVWASALSLEGTYKGVRLLTEGTLLAQDFQDTGGSTKTQKRKAMYAQLSGRVSGWEGVVRWNYIADAKVDGNAVSGHESQVATGVNYWFTPTIPFKAALVFQKGMKKRLAVQWAFGF